MLDILKTMKTLSMVSKLSDCAETLDEARLLIDQQQREIDKLRAELKAYRDGGLTEEILRRNDGYIKVGHDCAIVAASSLSNDKAQPRPSA